MGSVEGRGQRGLDSGAWRWGPGCGTPAQATSGTVTPPYVAYRAPLHPLSQNSCELAGQGPHFTDRKTKAPRQEGICPESHGWSVAKVEFGSRGWGAGRKLHGFTPLITGHSGPSSIGWPLSATPHGAGEETEAQKRAGPCTLPTDFSCSGCDSPQSPNVFSSSLACCLKSPIRAPVIG